MAKKGKEVRPDLETSKDEDEVEAENSPSKEEDAAAVEGGETPAKAPAKTPVGLEKTVLDAAGTWKKKLVKVWNPKGEAGKLKGSSDEEEDAESVEDAEPPMDPKEAVLEGLRARQKKLAKAKAKAEAAAEAKAKAESKAKAKAKNSAGKKEKTESEDVAEPSMNREEVILEGMRTRKKKLDESKAKAKAEAEAERLKAESKAKSESKAKAKKSAGKKEKTESEDVAEPSMTSEEIILEGMRIRKRKLAEAAEREKEKAFAKEVEAVVESEKEKDKQENKEDEQSIKEKNEGIILEAMKLRKQRLDEEKQAAGEAAATKKKKSSAKKKAPSAEPEPEAEAPNSREELIRKAMQIREEKQELLGDVDPELREKLSQAVMAKFKKINKGDW
ncbi:MAG: hypothetical protein ISR48_01170 [Alphaproteobacteria bacterium]|nr:hypothetical protein [Alphaproteobacteria bacterium]